MGLDGMKCGNRWKLSSAMDTFQRGRFTRYYPAKELGFSSGRWLGFYTGLIGTRRVRCPAAHRTRGEMR